MRIAVIIPTYNEALNIVGVIRGLLSVFRSMSQHEWDIIVVDGNSPDGTAEIVRNLQNEYLNIHILVEKEKRGIARAYIEGMRHAVDELNVDAFVEFDGDGQHNPEDLVGLTRALEEGADYCIGSRYVRGGTIPQTWALYRKLISRFGSLYARILLELPVHDVTSGFKMTRASFAPLLPIANEEELLSKDYAYKIQFLASMVDGGAIIREVPIVFREREHDVSKSTLKDLFESFRVTLLLRLKTLKRWRLLRVVLIGGVGFILQALLFELLSIQSSLLPASLATLVGGEVAILSNFFLNERFSFSDRRNDSRFFDRILRFHIVASGSVATQWLLVFIVENLTHDPLFLRLAFVGGVALGFVVNYTGYYFYVWRKRLKTTGDA
jgi:dolichol-phosphate mannosyltransferase